MGGLAIDGLVSGLDTTSIINQLIAIEQRPITRMQQQITGKQDEKTALLDISSRLLSLQSITSRLSAGTTFDQTQCQPVEQLRVGGLLAQLAEVVGGTNKSLTKVPQPHPVRDDACG